MKKSCIVINKIFCNHIKSNKTSCIEIEEYLKKYNRKNFDFFILNKMTLLNFKTFKKKETFLKGKLILTALIFWNKQDLIDLFLLIKQALNWGWLETRYSKKFKRYIKYPTILRPFAVFLYTKIMAEHLKEFASQYKELITLCFYDRSICPFVKCFRNQNKTVVDIQHGSITNKHFAYKKNVLKINSHLNPSIFICYNKTSFAYLKKLKLKDKQIFFIKPKKIKNCKKRTTILVSMQWGSKIPKQITNILKTVKQKKIIFRMHPRDKDHFSKKFQDSTFVSNLRTNNLFSIQSGCQPLENSLSKCGLHLTENSSVVHTASENKIKSIFWCEKKGKKMFKKEMRDGLAFFLDLKKPKNMLIKKIQSL